jgi:hypothetical protein
MSKIFVDQVDPKTATTLTLGTSGDTITVPVGAVTSLDGAVTVNDSSNDVDFTIEGNGDDDLFFVNGGTDRIGINAGATPEAKLHIIAAGASEPAAYFEQNSANDAMVLINNSRADDGSEISLKFNRADTVQGAIGTTSEGLSFWTNSTLSEKMRIASSGNVSIGGTASAGLFNLYSISHLLNGTVHTNSSDTGTIHNLRCINASGTLVGGITNDGSNTAFATSSDYRLKENETSITDGIDRIKQLKPYRFNFKADADKIMDGFFAHEVSGIVPEAVTGEKDAMHPEVLYTEEVLYTDEDTLPEGKNIGDVKHSIGDVKEETKIEPQGIDQSKLVPLLVAAVKELTAKVEALENA